MSTPATDDDKAPEPTEKKRKRGILRSVASIAVDLAVTVGITAALDGDTDDHS